MKITKRDSGILLMVVGVLVCLASFRFIYQNKQTEHTKLLNQLKTLESEEKGMAELQANRTFYEQEIARMNAENKEILDRFPVDILPENEIMYVVTMEDENDVYFSSLSYGSGQEILTGYEDETGLRASDIEMSLSYQSTYQGLKDVITYTGGQDRRMVINNVSASYDRTTGNVSGSMTLDQYLITGTDAVYNPPYVPSINIGTDNIFGTIELPVEPSEETEDETAEINEEKADEAEDKE